MPARFPTFDLWLCHNCFEVCLFEYQSLYPGLLSIGSLALIYDVRFPLSSGHYQCIPSLPFQFSYLPFSLPWYQRICLRLLIAYLILYYWLSCIHMNWINIVVHLCTIIFSIDNNFFIFYCLAKPLVFHKQQQNYPL